MKLIFMGTGDIAVPALEALLKDSAMEVAGVVTQPDRPVGRHQTLQASPVKTALERSGKRIPLFQPDNVNQPDALESIRGLEPEIIVVFAYGQILKRPLLDIPKRECVNVHASLLPKHRGAACIASAIQAGDAETGVSIMRVKLQLDAGDIFNQVKIPISPADTTGTLERKLAELAPSALVQVLKNIQAGTAKPWPQDDSQATYARRLTKADGAVDWTWDAGQIERHVRAMMPWPAAWTRLAGDGKMLKIFSANVSPKSGEPGKLLQIRDEGVVIGAGEGSVLLQEVQLEGKKRMSAVEFARGMRLAELCF